MKKNKSPEEIQEYQSALGKRTVILRKNLGLTQKEFAEAGDFSQSNLSLLENGGVTPNLGLFINIGENFPQVNMNWWILGRGDMFEEESEDLQIDEDVDPRLRNFFLAMNRNINHISKSAKELLATYPDKKRPRRNKNSKEKIYK